MGKDSQSTSRDSVLDGVGFGLVTTGRDVALGLGLVTGVVGFGML